jgi:hypothetical protein
MRFPVLGSVKKSTATTDASSLLGISLYRKTKKRNKMRIKTYSDERGGKQKKKQQHKTKDADDE